MNIDTGEAGRRRPGSGKRVVTSEGVTTAALRCSRCAGTSCSWVMSKACFLDGCLEVEVRHSPLPSPCIPLAAAGTPRASSRG